MVILRWEFTGGQETVLTTPFSVYSLPNFIVNSFWQLPACHFYNTLEFSSLSIVTGTESAEKSKIVQFLLEQKVRGNLQMGDPAHLTTA